MSVPPDRDPAANVNPYANLAVVVDPRLDAKSATRWYLIGGGFDGLWVSYLEGSTGPQIDTKAGFEIDGVQLRVRLDFGAAFIDHRGWYSNAGA